MNRMWPSAAPKCLVIGALWAMCGWCDFCLAAEADRKDSTAPKIKVVWKELADSGSLPEAARIDEDNQIGQVLTVTRSTETPQLIELAKLEKLDMTKRAFVLRGKVKFAGVGGEGFLETWTHFPEPKKGAFFSRTLAETGPMGKLRGDSPWRDFALPFTFDDPTVPYPEKIQFNLFLPQEGTVWLSDLELVELEPSEMDSLFSAGGLGFSLTGPTYILFSFVILGIAIGVGMATLKFLRTKQAQDLELRRMQAMDLS